MQSQGDLKSKQASAKVAEGEGDSEAEARRRVSRVLDPVLRTRRSSC